MNADAMRMELESFLNEGLNKGWGGWPTKRASAETTGSSLKRSSVSLAVTPIGGDGHSVLSLWHSFPWSLRSLDSSETACGIDIGLSNIPLPGDWDGTRLFSRES